MTAARLASELSGEDISEGLLRSWERGGLLSFQGPGQRVPADYGDADVKRAAAIATLRAKGFGLDEVRKMLGAGAGRTGEGSMHRVYSDEIERLAKALDMPREEVDRRVAEGVARAQKFLAKFETPGCGQYERLEKRAGARDEPLFEKRAIGRSPHERVAFEIGRLEARGLDLEKAQLHVSQLLPNAFSEFERAQMAGGKHTEEINKALSDGKRAELGLSDDIEVEEPIEALAKAHQKLGHWQDLNDVLRVVRQGPNGTVRVTLPHERFPLLAAWRAGNLPSGYWVTFGDEPINPSSIDWEGFDDAMRRRGFSSETVAVVRKFQEADALLAPPKMDR